MRKGLGAALVAATLALGSAGALWADGPALTTDGSGDGESGDVWPTPCGQGVLTECGVHTQKICRSWKTTYSINLSGSPTGAGGIGLVATTTCEYWDEKTVKLYKDVLMKFP